VSLRRGDRTLEITYRSQRDGSFIVGDGTRALIHRRSPSDIDIEIDGRRSVARITRAGDRVHIQTVRGTVEFGVVPRFEVPGSDLPAGGLTAPMPGAVLDVRVAVGDRVTTGITLVVMEAMKMEHHVTAPAEGFVTDVFVVAGQQVGTGAVLLMIETAESEDTPNDAPVSPR
jgi:propionyl-CoA carboxylase alpha chain